MATALAGKIWLSADETTTYDDRQSSRDVAPLPWLDRARYLAMRQPLRCARRADSPAATLGTCIKKHLADLRGVNNMDRHEPCGRRVAAAQGLVTTGISYGFGSDLASRAAEGDHEVESYPHEDCQEPDHWMDADTLCRHGWLFVVGLRQVARAGGLFGCRRQDVVVHDAP